MGCHKSYLKIDKFCTPLPLFCKIKFSKIKYFNFIFLRQLILYLPIL